MLEKLNNSNFWSLVVGVLFFVAKAAYPELPIDEADMLKLLLAALGLLGVGVPAYRALKG